MYAIRHTIRKQILSGSSFSSQVKVFPVLILVNLDISDTYDRYYEKYIINEDINYYVLKLINRTYKGRITGMHTFQSLGLLNDYLAEILGDDTYRVDSQSYDLHFVFETAADDTNVNGHHNSGKKLSYTPRLHYNQYKLFNVPCGFLTPGLWVFVYKIYWNLHLRYQLVNRNKKWNAERSARLLYEVAMKYYTKGKYWRASVFTNAAIDLQPTDHRRYDNDYLIELRANIYNRIGLKPNAEADFNRLQGYTMSEEWDDAYG